MAKCKYASVILVLQCLAHLGDAKRMVNGLEPEANEAEPKPVKKKSGPPGPGGCHADQMCCMDPASFDLKCKSKCGVNDGFGLKKSSHTRKLKWGCCDKALAPRHGPHACSWIYNFNADGFAAAQGIVSEAEAEFTNWKLHGKLVESFLDYQNKEFQKPTAMQQIDSAKGTVFVIGDLHGEFAQLLNVMSEIKYRRVQAWTVKKSEPGLLVCEPGVYYVFLGDYVDRGEKDIETVLLVLAYRALCPLTKNNGVVLLRGNHEDIGINKKYGFTEHLKSSGLDSLTSKFEAAWQTLPIAASLNGQVLMTHGGIPKAKVFVTNYNGRFDSFAKDFNKLKLPVASCPDPWESYMPTCDMMWSDPDAADEITPAHSFASSPRGAGYLFGKKAMESFIKSTGVKLIIRGHESQINGFEKGFWGFTIFTAADYGGMGNIGAFAEVSVADPLNPLIHTHAVILRGKDRGKIRRGPALTPKDYSALIQQLQASWASQANSSAETYDALANALANAAAPDPQCEALSEKLSEEAQALAAEIINRAKVSTRGNRQALAQQTKIEIDELGEALPLIYNPEQRLRKSCLAKMTSKVIEQTLAASGDATSQDIADMDKEVNDRQRQLEQADDQSPSDVHRRPVRLPSDAV